MNIISIIVLVVFMIFGIYIMWMGKRKRWYKVDLANDDELIGYRTMMDWLWGDNRNKIVMHDRMDKRIEINNHWWVKATEIEEPTETEGNG